MVTRHIKKKGKSSFQNSQMIVTKRMSKEEIMQEKMLQDAKRLEQMNKEPEIASDSSARSNAGKRRKR